MLKVKIITISATVAVRMNANYIENQVGGNTQKIYVAANFELSQYLYDAHIYITMQDT